MFRTTLFFMVSILAMNSALLAQTPYSEVTIYYDIQMEGDGSDDMAMAMAAMEGSTMTMMFLDDMLRLEMDMGMMKTIAINDESAKKGIVLMEMMGQKMYQTIDSEEMEEEEAQDDFEVEYTGQTQKIAGFKTKQVIVTYSDGHKAEMWLAEDIQPRSDNSQFVLKGVQGMPLKMDMVQEGMTMHMIASEVDTDKPSRSLFDMTPPEGYMEMDN